MEQPEQTGTPSGTVKWAKTPQYMGGVYQMDIKMTVLYIALDNGCIIFLKGCGVKPQEPTKQKGESHMNATEFLTTAFALSCTLGPVAAVGVFIGYGLVRYIYRRGFSIVVGMPPARKGKKK